MSIFQDTEHSSKSSPLIFIAICIVALSLRLVGLGSEYFWYDESYSVAVSGCDYYRMFQYLTADVHPPLFYILVHIYMAVKPLATIFYLRLFPLFWSMASLIVLYFLVSRFLSSRVALISSVLFAVSNFMVYYAQEVRMYSLLTFISLLSSYMLLHALQKNMKPLLFLGYMIANALGLYTHYHYIFFLLSHFVFIVYLTFQVRRAHLLTLWLISCAGSFLLFVPWLKYLFMQAGSERIGWLKTPSLFDLAGFFAVQIPFFGLTRSFLAFIPGSVMFLFLAYALIKHLRMKPLLERKYDFHFIMLNVIQLVIPPLIVFVISFVFRPLFHERFLIFCAPPFFILTAVVLIAMRPKFLALVIYIMFISMNLYAIYNEATRRTKDDWHAAFEVAHKTADSDMVILFQTFALYKAYIDYIQETIPYMRHDSILDARKEDTDTGKKNYLVLFYEAWQMDITPLSLLEKTAAVTNKGNIGGLNVVMYKDVALSRYFAHISAQKKAMSGRYDFFMLADSPLLDRVMCDDEINAQLDHFRWSRGDVSSFRINHEFSPGVYEFAFDVDTTRPTGVPAPELDIWIDNGRATTKMDEQRRMAIQIPVPISAECDYVDIRFVTNAFIPKLYYVSDDERNLGFIFYSLGIKRMTQVERGSSLFIDIGEPSTDEVFIRHGFYPPERSETTFRWTTGDAEIMVPVSPIQQGNRTLKFRAALTNPVTERGAVKVYLDDSFIGPANVMRDFSESQVALPTALSSGMHVLRIVNDSWIPAEVTENNDKRHLGVCIDWIELTR